MGLKKAHEKGYQEQIKDNHSTAECCGNFHQISSKLVPTEFPKTRQGIAAIGSRYTGKKAEKKGVSKLNLV